MTRKPPVQQVPTSIPPRQVLDCRKREFAHLATNPNRRFFSMNAKGG
jgi:hypothetical protein